MHRSTVDQERKFQFHNFWPHCKYSINIMVLYNKEPRFQHCSFYFLVVVAYFYILIYKVVKYLIFRQHLIWSECFSYWLQSLHRLTSTDYHCGVCGYMQLHIWLMLSAGSVSLVCELPVYQTRLGSHSLQQFHVIGFLWF